MLKQVALCAFTISLLGGAAFANPAGGDSMALSLSSDHNESQAQESKGESSQFGGSGSCGTVKISNCVVKPAQGKNTAAYGVFKQSSDSEDRLVSAHTHFAEKTEIHDMAMENGVMKMNQLKEGIKIPANGEIIFQPGGKHIMLIGVKEGFAQQKEIPVTLNFEKAGPVEVTFIVDPNAVKKFDGFNASQESPGSGTPNSASDVAAGVDTPSASASVNDQAPSSSVKHGAH